MQAKQHGVIGLDILTQEVIIYQNLSNCRFLDPLVFGDYPESMKRNVGSRLPSFTPHQSKLVKGSCDFFGLNHYGTMYIKDDPDSLKNNQSDYLGDMAVKILSKQGPLVPDGQCLKQVYGNPPVFIHENGQMTYHNASLDASLNDTSRIFGCFHWRNGSNTRGYFVWSFMDLFELYDGLFKSSFGLYYVDFEDPDLKRYAKFSAYWYSNFLREEGRISTYGITEAFFTLSDLFFSRLNAIVSLH
ncbi:hypothetical protein NE237_016130 [Protea cynaroides]|uniref:Uncharacterized protein n=1 Tax=Protea cynaroides TaxID=273540 RepID=A0A9Q0KFM3_9MAGN|nr:hypothetical protein NE237_016130 [Protea cynaroides]